VPKCIGSYKCFNSIHKIAENCLYFVFHSGADITARDNDEMMPLMLAIQAGNVEIISVMLDLGCDIHAEAKNGKSIIEWAIEKEYTSLVKVGFAVETFSPSAFFVRLLLREARKLLHNLWMMRKTHSYILQQNQAL